MFFKSEQNLRVLNDFMNRTEHFSFPNEILQMRLENSREIIGSIAKSPEGWDKRCDFNIHHLGERFIDALRSFSTSDEGKVQINSIYTKAFRFLCEFDFLIGPDLELNFELESVKTAIVNDAINNDSEVRSQIIYAAYMMPANIVKRHINNKNLVAVSEFTAKLEKAEKLRTDWDQEIIAKHDEVKALDKKLEEIKTGFNFVGLYKGFADLSDKKSSELNWLFLSLIGMSVLILAPLVYEFLTFSVVGEKTGFQVAELLKLIPLISMELILIYFFRIILMNYRSTKAQIMQIELRQTLCQFIQSYAEYASEIKSKDATSLEKFENLIFSGILSDPEKLPSTFDGLEQIGKLLKNVKGV
ncbi:TPA: hypothetical protein NKZ82_004714 [Vibrio parahaemolyticus]|uniref:hypothetical protein n=1 Tax=Vibrio parahaemolyticus TaxID=670 RepID=UPI001120F8F3|nr:hypothetical protein [Vibrio parahaemolyticus]ELV8719437.1 hypothetical protein [Vibrio vulnificus]TOQ47958.1 hypothetical protein CGG94_24720 [Vibrio parahaemolyticus]HCG7544646.1 hypothetical protein [Vibrio parahaemolyticus]HCH0358912.1 hypothetical protein [Vibrio parahaemolyticus]HCH5750653.1 hypothetical protein [Vibrio parahaemolyticus]